MLRGPDQSAKASPAKDRTLVICKPDAVERGLAGEIISRFERKGLTLMACELRTVDRATAEEHYAEHEGKPFYEDLLAFIGRSPAVVLVVEGPEDTFAVVRSMMVASVVDFQAGPIATLVTSSRA